jgi:hypothetical protein
MPTGYTDQIKDGISFEEFAWGCARAFGALIMMRDEPADAPIPEFKPSEYAQKVIAESEARLSELQSMDEQQIAAASIAEYEREYKQVEKWNQDKSELRDKYAAMLSKVLAWNPPTPEHQGL